MELLEAVDPGPSRHEVSLSSPFAESLGWAKRCVERLCHAVAASKDPAEAIRSDEMSVVLTTNFSGIGTAEAALGQVMACLQGVTDKFPTLPKYKRHMCWSATDNDADCRDVLALHGGSPSYKIEHIFSHVEDRVPVSVLRHLEFIQRECRQGFQQDMHAKGKDSRPACMQHWTCKFLAAIESVHTES